MRNAKQMFKKSSINFARKDLTAWPEDLFTKVEVQSLEGFQNKLPTIPSEIGALTKLTRLVLWSNDIRGLPNEIGALTRLTVLGLN